MPINVAIVEDDSGIREGLAALLKGTPSFRCAGAFPSAEAALRQIPLKWPDVILMDLSLPKMPGRECVVRLKALNPKPQIIIFTVNEDSDEIFKALMAGASGYLIKATPFAEILNAIEDVHRGGSPMSSHIARKLVEYFHKKGQSSSVMDALSKRELEVLTQLAKGSRYKEIADELSISVLTVRSHLQRIYEKLHVRSRTEAVVKFLDGRKPA
jgi:DNA-binding NarL/FixJ family response regulator